MKTIFILMVFLEILLIPLGVESKTCLINTDRPNSSGVCIIAEPFKSDTISFSNGIAFPFYCQTSIILEPPPLYNGIKADSTVNLLKAGFKKDPLAVWKNDGPIKYYSSRDTIWSASTSCPDSLMYLDSLWNNPPDTNSSPRGKWLWVDALLQSPFGRYKVYIQRNYNNIMYFNTKQNKLKFQISNIYINQYPTTPPWADEKVDSIKILWAVDSLGNGKFKETTSIKTINAPTGKKKPPPSFRLINGRGLYFLQTSGEQVLLFDIKGRQTNGMSQRTNVFPSGVIIYKIDGNNTSSLGKIVMR